MSEENTRYLCLNKINELINNDSISKQVEEGIYQYVVDDICRAKNLPVNWNNSYFKRAYLNRCISLYSNLDKNSYIGNELLINKVLNEEIDPYKLAFMTPQELFPENWKDILEKKNAENEFLYANKHMSYTDEYTCGRCKQKKCSYFLSQTRSADEPMNLFVTCLNCGHKWSS